MLRGMYTSISAMVNLQSSQTVITNNIANVNTTGFKEERLMSKTFDDVLIAIMIDILMESVIIKS